MTTTESTRVLSSNQPFEAHAHQIRAAVFGALVKLAASRITNYHSDLYHDAMWIEDNIAGPIIFWFAIRQSGTHIGTDEELIRSIPDPDADVYLVTLTADAGRWTVTTRGPGPTT